MMRVVYLCDPFLSFYLLMISQKYTCLISSSMQVQPPDNACQSVDFTGNRDDDDSDDQHPPPPLPSKVRLNSDASLKENSFSGPPSSSLTEAPSSMVLPSELRDSTNIVNNYKVSCLLLTSPAYFCSKNSRQKRVTICSYNLHGLCLVRVVCICGVYVEQHLLM